MKKLMFLLMLFLTLQMSYGQMTTIDTKYVISTTKTDSIWCNWSKPLLKNITFILRKAEIVINYENTHEFFYLCGYKGRIHQIDTQYNDICTVDYYNCTNIEGNLLQIGIYKYNSGELAFALIYPKIEYLYSTRKITNY